MFVLTNSTEIRYLVKSKIAGAHRSNSEAYIHLTKKRENTKTSEENPGLTKISAQR